MEYGSKAATTAGLTTGIIGTALGAMSNGILPNLLNGNGNAAACACNENMLVNRYEAAQNAMIASLQSDKKLLEANTYVDSKLLDMYKYVNGEIRRIDGELCDQKVLNATQIGTIGCIQGQIAQLQALTKMVIPNGSVCPGWGDVTVTVTPAPTTGA